MGLKVGAVYLEKYNPIWKEMFEEEKRNLEKIFNDKYISIEHVGSTSIIGLSAKPIIDIQVSIRNFSDFEHVRNYFEKMPYSIKMDSDSDEILVRKGDENNRTHFIHIVEDGSLRCINTLLFRDYLRNHDDIKKDYENLKIDLAKKFENDRKSYTASKNEFIKSVLEMARNEVKEV